jgi:hypothetical protein
MVGEWRVKNQQIFYVIRYNIDGSARFLSFYSFALWSVAVWSILLGVIVLSYLDNPALTIFAVVSAITFIPVYLFIAYTGINRARDYRWRLDAERRINGRSRS